MDFSDFMPLLSDLSTKDLPGLEAQLKMVPSERIIPKRSEIDLKNAKMASVLVLFYPSNPSGETRFLLMVRSAYPGTHSSQISFPGGKSEKQDKDAKETALRETEEEIGIQRSQIKVHLSLTETYIPPSNFLVKPFIGSIEKPPVFIPNHEVAELMEVTLSDLLNDKKVENRVLDTSYKKQLQVPCFIFNDKIVWGATAMILSEIKELIKGNMA